MRRRGSSKAEEVLYREFHSLRWLTRSLIGSSLLLLTVATVTDYPTGGWLVLIGIASFFVGQHLVAVYGANRIVLTPSRLEVGRETFRREDLDFIFGVQPPLVLSPDEEHRVESETPLPPDHQVHIAGGSWGRRMGTAMILLRVKEGRVLAVFTRRPPELDRILTAWLELPDLSEPPPGEAQEGS